MYSGYNLTKLTPGNYLTSDSPGAATAAFIGGDVVAWKGFVNNDQGIYYTIIFSDSASGVQWNPQHTLPNAGTSVGPALACFKPSGQLTNVYLAWKGESDDTRIFVANASGLQGSNPQEIEWSPGRQRPVAGTDASPALAATADMLVMAWKGLGSGSRIWWSQSKDGQNWSAQAAIDGTDTSAAPALAAIGNTLFLAWRGGVNDEGVYWAKCSDGKTWQNQGSIGGGSGCGPALAGLSDGRLCLVWKGQKPPPGDTRIFYAYLDNPQSNTSWGPQQVINGQNTIAKPALASGGGLVWNGPTLAGLPASETIYGSIYVGVLALLTAPPPPPPIVPVIYYKNGKIYGVGFPSNEPCSVTITEGAGFLPAGPWTGDISYPGIAIQSPCDGNPGQYFVVQASNSSGQSATLKINC
jgi:hypothetical protein